MTAALDILQREHRALGAVLHCFEQLLGEIRKQQLEPDFALFEAIIAYIQDFPDRFHHPKEDEIFFPRLLERAPEQRETIATLQSQHHDGVRSTNELKWKFAAWKEKGERAFPSFDEAARLFIDFQRRHIGLEEREVIPAARRTFTAADWEKVNGGFANNDDPIFGRRPKAVYDALFTKIASLAPAPHGFAPRKEPKKARPKRPDPDWRRRIVDLHWM